MVWLLWYAGKKYPATYSNIYQKTKFKAYFWSEMSFDVKDGLRETARLLVDTL